MKLGVFIILVFFSEFTFSQSYLEFNRLGLNNQSEQWNYVNKQIGLQPEWNARKIELYCMKSGLSNRQGQYEESDSILKIIPQKKIQQYNCQGIWHLSKALVFKYQRNLEPAFDEFKLAKKFFRKKKMYCELADAYLEEAEFYRKIGKCDLGLECIDSARVLYTKYQCNPVVKVKLLNRLAAIANEYEDSGLNSIEISKECIHLAKAQKEYYWLAVSYNEIAYSYYNAHMPDSALYYSKMSELEFRKFGLLLDALHAKLGCAFHAGTDQKTIEILKELIVEVEETQINYPMYEVYDRLFALYKKNRDFENALKYDEMRFYDYYKDFVKDNNLKLAKITDEFKSVQLESENEKIRIESKHRKELIDRRNVQFYSVLTFSVFLLVFIVVLWLNARNRKKLNAELKLKNDQKDSLIQEVHHRVKNNLQFVKSIILFQSTKEGTNDQSLKDISRRIDAISLVHEMLYNKNEEFNEVSIKDYLQKLIQYSEELYQSENPIEVILTIDDVFLPISKLESIGIICSELLSNSVKYAFDQETMPKFTIEFTHVKEDVYELHTFDNGTEIPVTSQKDGLGMQMIDIYSRQLKGEYSLSREAGYHYRLTFKIK